MSPQARPSHRPKFSTVEPPGTTKRSLKGHMVHGLGFIRLVGVWGGLCHKIPESLHPGGGGGLCHKIPESLHPKHAKL